MAFLGHVNDHVEETGYWEILGVEDYVRLILYAVEFMLTSFTAAQKSLFDDSLSFQLNPLEMGQSRYLLFDLCVYHKEGSGCAARVTWTIITVPTRAGRPPPFPRPLFLERDGVRIQVPMDPLLEPIFYTFHRWRDIILSPRITVAIQFFETGCRGSRMRKIRANIMMTPLARRRFASCAQTVEMQVHPYDPIDPSPSDLEEEELTDDDASSTAGDAVTGDGQAVLLAGGDVE